MSWTEERVALLRKMWGEGKTAAEIAKELGGVTRNAVIGKAHRLRLSNRVSPIQQNTKKPSRIAEMKAAAKAAAAVPRAVIQVKGIKLSELKEKLCRWPLGDPKEPDFLFCGCQAVPGLPYCGDHARIAYQVTTRARLLKPEDVDTDTAAGYDEAEEKEAVVA